MKNKGENINLPIESKELAKFVSSKIFELYNKQINIQELIYLAPFLMLRYLKFINYEETSLHPQRN